MRQQALLVPLIVITLGSQVAAQERATETQRVTPNFVSTISSVQIRPPIGSQAASYCKFTNRTGERLELTFRNAGNIEAPPGTVSVRFGGGTTETTQHPAIRPYKTVRVSVPSDCAGDCAFTVEWRTQPNAQLTTVEGHCIG